MTPGYLALKPGVFKNTRRVCERRRGDMHPHWHLNARQSVRTSHKDEQRKRDYVMETHVFCVEASATSKDLDGESTPVTLPRNQGYLKASDGWVSANKVTCRFADNETPASRRSG